jgi:pyridoxal phosphate enzyme (YggS family)
MFSDAIKKRVQAAFADIERACGQSGRDASAITVVAASESRSIEEILAAHRAGITDFGANYWQEARDKVDRAPETVTWHFIGALQDNKAKHIARHFHVLQSLESMNLANTLSKSLIAIDRTCKVLVEVNIDSERSKSGLGPVAALDFVLEAAELPNLDVCGLMTMGEPGANEAILWKRFRQMRALFEGLPVERRKILSMGMTADFEVAVEEGATMVRIGTAIFGERPRKEG